MWPPATSQSAPKDKLKAYRAGYAKFQYDTCMYYVMPISGYVKWLTDLSRLDEDFPDGWPKTAAFFDSCDSFSIFRRFGQSHSRLLVTHMTEITNIEKQLAKLDQDDVLGGHSTQYRLKSTYHAEGLDTTKRDLLKQLEERIFAYGIVLFRRLFQHSTSVKSYEANRRQSLIDALLLNHQRLKNLDQTPERDHDNVFKWIWKHKPLDTGEYDWIFYPDDFVSVVPAQTNRFEDLVRRHIDAWPNSWLKVSKS